MNLKNFYHHSLDLNDKFPIVYTAISKQMFHMRVWITKYVLEKECAPINPFMNFDFAFYGLSKKSIVVTANNNLLCLADELWVFGPISDGVLAEILRYKKLNRPIRYFSIHDFTIAEIQANEAAYEIDVLNQLK
jgi:hypothetical protein